MVERYETFVHPGRPIPAEITRLTGIKDLDVINAPSPREAVAGLADFVGGMPVLAHNASFDRTFIEAVPGGHEVTDTWIDTLALSRIALPRLTTHRLADMAQAFGVAPVTHNAGDDVDALIGMWRVILCALADLPRGLLGHLASMQPDVEWSYRPVLAHLAAEQGGEPFSLKAVRKALVGESPFRPREDAAELQGALVAPDQATSDAVEGRQRSRRRSERRADPHIGRAHVQRLRGSSRAAAHGA